MTLQELRFLSIYLSKINPKDINTKMVNFLLFYFQKIMDLTRLKIDYLKNVTDNLLCKIVRISVDEKGGYTSLQLFKECIVKTDESGEWYVEISNHDKALLLMFELNTLPISFGMLYILKVRMNFNV